MTAAQPRLAAYLARIGITAATPTLEGITAMLFAHRRAIAFENLDIRLGRAIRIDSTSAFDKLVTRRRGGYCFEQNRLFSDMLDAIGVPHRLLMARVRLGPASDILPGRSHVLLFIPGVGRHGVVADAGFGGSLVPPLPLEDGAMAQTADGASHRLRRIGEVGDANGQWLLERAGPHGATDGRAEDHDDWQKQYSFDLAEVAQADLEQGNHWTSTRPGERFTSLHIASIVLPDGFASMVDRMLTVHRDGKTAVQEIADPAGYADILQSLFKLDFSAQDAAALPLFSAD